MKLNEDELRKKFEDWFEADAMPLEAGWFKRDSNFPDLYNDSCVEHSWDGFKAGWDSSVESEVCMRPVETAPKDGTYVLLFGDSGYIGTPLRCEVCKYDAEFRPKQPWVNHAGNSFLDGGAFARFWMPLPEVPND
jgi:hypothetical protein